MTEKRVALVTTKHDFPVVAHQLLAAAKIIVEELTELGYDDRFAEGEYKKFKSLGVNDQAAIRMIAAAVEIYDGNKKTNR